MNGLRIIDPGVKATVQDLGRTGVRHHGLARGGVLDLRSAAWANKLLDNNRNAAGVEIVLGGFRAEALSAYEVSVTGARAEVTVNGQAVDMWRSLQLAPGDELAIGHARNHRLIYVAVRGGFETRKWFGSRSVVEREALEGCGLLQAEDVLPTGSGEPTLTTPRIAPPQAWQWLERPAALGLIPGYQYHQFQPADLRRLTTTDYQVSDQSDRMGYRLAGTPMAEPPPGIVSEGIVPGAVQVPGDGQPIALLADCQTIGGYPKPGVITSLDCGLLAQQLPGARVRFEWTDVLSAQNQRRLFERHYHQTVWSEDGRSLHWH
ncbi:MAG: biotin-dependent carboxyltransferase family protein [Marinobacter sp.]|nr:biotin-dependent carboxyltransferase family protein [Marinobacter sp.]